jgi:ribonucleoside-diphosphate reductase alpha chain
MDDTTNLSRVHRDNPTIGLTFREETGCGAAFFSIKFNWHDKVRLIEVFCGSSSKGGCASSTKMTGRLVSLHLQRGTPIEEIIDQLESEVCPTARYRAGKDEAFKKTGNSSCSRALASAMKKTLQAQKFFEQHQGELKAIFSATEDLREKSIEAREVRIHQVEEQKYKEESIVEKAERLGVIPHRVVGDEGRGEDFWVSQGLCPDCRAKLRHESGCVSCTCGFSRC